MKREIIIESDLNFYASSAESIKSFIGEIGEINGDDYCILEGKYEIDIEIDRMLEMTSKHEIEVVILQGKIYLN